MWSNHILSNKLFQIQIKALTTKEDDSEYLEIYLLLRDFGIFNNNLVDVMVWGSMASHVGGGAPCGLSWRLVGSLSWEGTTYQLTPFFNLDTNGMLSLFDDLLPQCMVVILVEVHCRCKQLVKNEWKHNMVRFRLYAKVIGTITKPFTPGTVSVCQSVNRTTRTIAVEHCNEHQCQAKAGYSTGPKRNVCIHVVMYSDGSVCPVSTWTPLRIGRSRHSSHSQWPLETDQGASCPNRATLPFPMTLVAGAGQSATTGRRSDTV